MREKNSEERVILSNQEITLNDIKRLQAAKIIVIDKCTYNGDWNKDIAIVINKKVEDLSINDCGIKDSFLNSLGYLPELKILRLGKNDLQNNCAEYILKMCKRLDILEVEGNPPKLCHQTFKKLLCKTQFISFFKMPFQSKRLYIGGYQFSPKQVRIIADSFVQLKELSIGACQLGPEGARILMQHLPNLELLDINSNELGSEGMQYVAQFSKLKFLNVSNNSIRDRGAKLLARSRSQLKSLDIRDSTIQMDGYISITRGLPHLISLYIDFASEQVALAISKNLKNIRWLKITSYCFKMASFELFLRLRKLEWMSPINLPQNELDYISKNRKFFLPLLRIQASEDTLY